MSIELGDGTTVFLNHGSKLQYPYPFNGDIRKVFSTGEVYFEVAHNAKVPFIVGTNRLDVKATEQHSMSALIQMTMQLRDISCCSIVDG